MSRTKRLKPSWDNNIPHEQRDNKSLKETTYGRRMKQYATERGKHGVELSSHRVGITRLSKLVTRNANRSKKKTMRQIAKKEIKKGTDG